LSHVGRHVFRLLGKSIALTAVVLVIVPAQALALALTNGPGSTPIALRFHRWVCAVLGVDVAIRGTPARAAQVVFACNHLSYLDVAALGSVLRATFVAKDDVRGWPLAGVLARLQNSVFVSRDPRRASEIVAAMRAALAVERRLVVFAEGTTSDGSRVLPFKSSAFAALTDPVMAEVVVQPVTIELLAVNGRAIAEGGDRDRYAYHGDARLIPHLIGFMRGSGAGVCLTFHAPLQRLPDDTRKTLATRAHARVAQSNAREHPA
jgi:lyso-ornithine lipid O-acyltransferase